MANPIEYTSAVTLNEVNGNSILFTVTNTNALPATCYLIATFIDDTTAATPTVYTTTMVSTTDIAASSTTYIALPIYTSTYGAHSKAWVSASWQATVTAI